MTELSTCYEFDHFCVDPVRRLLLAGVNRVPLPPKAFDLLLVLVRNAPRVLHAEELMQTLWPDTSVEDANLTQNIFLIRKALGETSSEHRYVVTIPRQGYCFVCSVRQRTETDAGIGLPFPSGIELASRKVTVLPFQSLTRDPHDEYLVHGIAETLSDRLASIPHLIVRSVPATALKQSGLDKDPQLVGRRLNVDSVLCGTLQRSGERVRIHARMVRVRDGSLEWTRQVEASFTEIFALQDLVVEQVVNAIPLKLTSEERKRLRCRPTENTTAYLTYLRGRYFWSKRTPEGFQRASECFEQAGRQDPGYALAHAGMADCNTLLACYNLTPPLEAWSKAKAAAIRALTIDDQLAEAHATLALVWMASEWAWSEAERACRRALVFGPNYAFAFDCYAEFCSALGRHTEAIAAIKRAQELEPLSLIVNCDVGWNLFRARRYEESAAQLRHTVEMDPSYAMARWTLGWVLHALSMYEEACSEFEAASSMFDNGTIVLSSLGVALAACGEAREARNVLDQLLLLKTTERRYVSPYDLALICVGLGEETEAFRWLEKALDERPFDLVYLKVDPRLDPLRSNAQFESLLNHIGLGSVSKANSPVCHLCR